jgi:hypothetical protein
MYQATGARALINGQVVAVGDSVDGYAVETIASDYVALRRADEIVTLRVKKESS